MVWLPDEAVILQTDACKHLEIARSRSEQVLLLLLGAEDKIGANASWPLVNGVS